jgi:hypothetical protein
LPIPLHTPVINNTFFLFPLIEEASPIAETIIKKRQ